MPTVFNARAARFKDDKSKKYMIRIEYDEKNEDGTINKRRIKRTGLEYSAANMKVVEEQFIPPFLYKLNSTVAVEAVLQKPAHAQYRYTVKRLGDTFLENLNPKNRVNSKNTYEQQLRNHIYPVFSETDVRDIKISDLEDWVNNILRKNSVKTLKNVKIPFNGIFDRAVRESLITVNPLHSLGDMIATRAKSEDKLNTTRREVDRHGNLVNLNVNEVGRVDPFTKGEVDQLVYEADGWFKDYLIISFYTAMRPSEVVYLKWSSVSIKQRQISVQGAITGKQTESEEDMTKTHSSNRIIHIPSQVVEAFIRMKKRTNNTENKTGSVFINQYCKPFRSPQMLNDYHFKKLFGIKKNRNTREEIFTPTNIKFRCREIRQLRHSFASYVLTNDLMPIALLSQMMGHSTIDVTLKKYARYRPDNESEIVKYIDNL